jgi:alkylation response protein AidB-like acyl-CoA dehydrogenase
VPRSHLDALAETGLLGATVDPDVSPAEARGAQEALAGTCLATWFVQAQHHTPVGLVAAAPEPIRERLLPLLTSGVVVAGIAFSHLRRWPGRPVAATRVPGGWRFDGVAPWYTGWTLNDVAVLAGASEAGEVVFALVPAQAAPGLAATPVQPTAALAGTRTVALHLDGVVVGDDGVLAVRPIADWRAADDARATNATPAIFGVTAAAIRELVALDEPGAAAAAARLEQELASVRAAATHLLDAVPAAERLDERVALRAAALRLAVDATSTHLAAVGGRGLGADHAAQRRAREALFLLIQGQTARVRAAYLAG